MTQLVGAFPEFERAMLKERTKAGLDSAREEGRIGGPRPKLSPQQQTEIRKMVSKGDKATADAAAVQNPSCDGLSPPRPVGINQEDPLCQ